MTWRSTTPESEKLGELFRRHHELDHPELTKEAVAELAGVSLSVYDNIEKGRLVSIGSYRRAAKGVGLPGGIPRVEAIYGGEPDPGPGPAASPLNLFHPSAPGDDAQAARLAELIGRLESVLRRAETELVELLRSNSS